MAFSPHHDSFSLIKLTVESARFILQFGLSNYRDGFALSPRAKSIYKFEEKYA
jgi:hypothetical protein